MGSRRVLVETCKLNDIDPVAYLTDVLTRIVNRHPNHDENALSLSDQDRSARRLSRPRQRSAARQHRYVRGLSRLTDIALGAMAGGEFVGNRKRHWRKTLRGQAALDQPGRPGLPGLSHPDRPRQRLRPVRRPRVPAASAPGERLGRPAKDDAYADDALGAGTSHAQLCAAWHDHAPKIKAWLVRLSHYHVHFTPTTASWINQIERWFTELTRKQIQRGVHTPSGSSRPRSTPSSNCTTIARSA